VKFRRHRGNVAREEVFLNLTPLIDVIFVLLLFFVVSTTFSRPAQLRINLPEASSGAPSENSSKQLEVGVSASGDYSLNGKALARHDLATLLEALRRESNGDNSLPLIISADAASSHQAVVTAMDAAARLGFSKLRITTVEASGQ